MCILLYGQMQGHRRNTWPGLLYLLVPGTRRYDRAVGEFIDRVQRLTKCGVAVHVVFDGTTSPCKREEAARRQKAGSSIRTPGLQRAIIAALKHLGLRYTVAPYEAEAQPIRALQAFLNFSSVKRRREVRQPSFLDRSISTRPSRACDSRACAFLASI